MDFDRLLLLKRGVKSPALGLPRNWQGNSSLPAAGFDDEIVLLDLRHPEDTEQRAYYGSNSYWPNSMFYARPIPGHPSQFVTVISGHHDIARMGELLLFDVAKGDHEAGGAVQRIPGRGKKVEPILRDGLVRPGTQRHPGGYGEKTPPVHLSRHGRAD